MNNAKTTAISGCIIWFVLISVVATCVMPVFYVVGMFSSYSDFAIQTVGEWICPEGTTPTSYSYQTMMSGDNGFDEPAMAYELHCVNPDGTLSKNDPIMYSFIWVGLCLLLGAISSGLLTFAISVPGGMLVTKVLNLLFGKKPVQN